MARRRQRPAVTAGAANGCNGSSHRRRYLAVRQRPVVTAVCVRQRQQRQSKEVAVNGAVVATADGDGGSGRQRRISTARKRTAVTTEAAVDSAAAGAPVGSGGG